jgi:hypothetical protein
MKLTGESLQQDGKARLERLTFFHQGPDRVRQLWEQSADGGRSWKTVFDGEYRRRVADR